MLPSSDATSEQQITVRNLLLQGELLKLLSVFSKAGIPCIVLKGIPLAKRLNVTLNERRILDNDLLLKRADIPRAVQLLNDLGYQARPFSDLDTNLKFNFQHALFARRHGMPMVAELHWQAFAPNLFCVDESLAWERTQLIELDGHPVQVFDEALTLIHLAAHYLQHSFNESRILRDVARAWNAFGPKLDLTDLVQLARQTECLPALEFALATALDLGMIQHNPLGASRRVKLLRKLLPAHQIAADSDKRDYTRVLPSFLLGNPRRVILAIQRAVLPPVAAMPSIYQEAPSLRLYGRYLTRPFRPIARALGWKL